MVRSQTLSDNDVGLRLDRTDETDQVSWSRHTRHTHTSRTCYTVKNVHASTFSRPHDDPIGVTYGVCPANDKSQNFIWLKTIIFAKDLEQVKRHTGRLGAGLIFDRNHTLRFITCWMASAGSSD